MITSLHSSFQDFEVEMDATVLEPHELINNIMFFFFDIFKYIMDCVIMKFYFCININSSLNHDSY